MYKLWKCIMRRFRVMWKLYGIVKDWGLGGIRIMMEKLFKLVFERWF